jgi:Tripartite tricarboxylate transporter TctB family
MADTMGHSASTTRNGSMALGIVVLALAPQIFEFLWSFGTIFGLGSGRGALFGSFGADAKKAFSSDVQLALIYSYPLFAVAIVTVFLKVRTAQDYIGGVALAALALFALWASSDLQSMRGFSFGAGTAPRMFGVLMLALGAGIALTGLVTEGPGLSHYAWRGPLFVSAAILFFALAIRPLGLIVTAFASFMIATLGTHETRWIEAVIVGACLTAGCAILFPYILGLPMPMLPRFLIQ